MNNLKEYVEELINKVNTFEQLVDALEIAVTTVPLENVITWYLQDPIRLIYAEEAFEMLEAKKPFIEWALRMGFVEGMRQLASQLWTNRIPTSRKRIAQR